MRAAETSQPPATSQLPDPAKVTERAELLPEEQAAGSVDPEAQAEAILVESRERTEDPDPEASTQTSRRRSEETA